LGTSALRFDRGWRGHAISALRDPNGGWRLAALLEPVGGARRHTGGAFVSGRDLLDRRADDGRGHVDATDRFEDRRQPGSDARLVALDAVLQPCQVAAHGAGSHAAASCRYVCRRTGESATISRSLQP
jgi:hypothetical protein